MLQTALEVMVAYCIRCDSCVNAVAAVMGVDYRSLQEFVAVLEADGWHVVDGKARCRQCREELTTSVSPDRS